MWGEAATIVDIDGVSPGFLKHPPWRGAHSLLHHLGDASFQKVLSFDLEKDQINYTPSHVYSYNRITNKHQTHAISKWPYLADLILPMWCPVGNKWCLCYWSVNMYCISSLQRLSNALVGGITFISISATLLYMYNVMFHVFMHILHLFLFSKNSIKGKSLPH